MYGHREKIERYHQEYIEAGAEINFDASWHTKESTWCVYRLERNDGSVKRCEFIGHPRSENEEYDIHEFETVEEYKNAIKNIKHGNSFPHRR